jgi:hypothetical protein
VEGFPLFLSGETRAGGERRSPGEGRLRREIAEAFPPFRGCEAPAELKRLLCVRSMSKLARRGHLFAQYFEKLASVAPELRIPAFLDLAFGEPDRLLVRVEAEAMDERSIALTAGDTGKLRHEIGMAARCRLRQHDTAWRSDDAQFFECRRVFSYDPLGKFDHSRVAGSVEYQARAFELRECARRSEQRERFVHRRHLAGYGRGGNNAINLLRGCYAHQRRSALDESERPALST